jgi:hypothetical protein
MYAHALFKTRNYEQSIALFQEIQVDAREIIGLYPPSIAGRWSKQTESSEDTEQEVLREDQVEFNEAVSCLIRFLTVKRRWLMRAIQSKQENTDAESLYERSSVEKSPPLEAARSLPPPSVTSHHTNMFELGDYSQLPPLGELLAIAEAVDTTLLRAYMCTNRAFVGSLLRVKNYCNLDESVQILLEHEVS